MVERFVADLVDDQQLGAVGSEPFEVRGGGGRAQLGKQIAGTLL